MDWVALRPARIYQQKADFEGAKRVLRECLNHHPNSRPAHFELAMVYIHHGTDSEVALAKEHLRRSFVDGDQNFDAQFWYARALFLDHQYEPAGVLFAKLRHAEVPAELRNRIQRIVRNEDGSTKLFAGEVINPEDTFAFLKTPSFARDIFVHRSKADEDKWHQMQRGIQVILSVGFNMRGARAASVSAVGRTATDNIGRSS